MAVQFIRAAQFDQKFTGPIWTGFSGSHRPKITLGGAVTIPKGHRVYWAMAVMDSATLVLAPHDSRGNVYTLQFSAASVDPSLSQPVRLVCYSAHIDTALQPGDVIDTGYTGTVDLFGVFMEFSGLKAGAISPAVADRVTGAGALPAAGLGGSTYALAAITVPGSRLGVHVAAGTTSDHGALGIQTLQQVNMQSPWAFGEAGVSYFAPSVSNTFNDGFGIAISAKLLASGSYTPQGKFSPGAFPYPNVTGQWAAGAVLTRPLGQGGVELVQGQDGRLYRARIRET